MRNVTIFLLFCGCATRPQSPVPPLRQPIEASVIERAAGAKASTEVDGVVRITWARTDVTVNVDGQTLPPSAGLTSWAAFQTIVGGALLAGDTVVFEDEVDAAMDAAFASGLSVTALHNHFFYDEPRAFFMHIEGHGSADRLASAVRAVWDAVKTVRAGRPHPAQWFGGHIAEEGSIDSNRLASILGHRVPIAGGVAKMTIAREGTMHGIRVGGSMGLTTWVAFVGSDLLASVDGDFVMTQAEVQPVLRALRRSGIHIVALHNHMMGEQPALFFTHFWGRGSAAELARGLRAALDAQAAAQSR